MFFKIFWDAGHAFDFILELPFASQVSQSRRTFLSGFFFMIIDGLRIMRYLNHLNVLSGTCIPFY